MRTLSLLFLAVLALAPGCQSARKVGAPPAGSDPALAEAWAQAKRQDLDRLDGDEKRPRGSWEIAGDVVAFFFYDMPRQLLRRASGELPSKYALRLEDTSEPLFVSRRDSTRMLRASWGDQPTLREVASTQPTTAASQQPQLADEGLRSSTDRRREALFWLSEYTWGRKDPYLKRYEQIAYLDRSPLLQAAAVRAMNQARDARGTTVYIRLLEHQHQLVRLEAAKALANIPDPLAIPALTRHVQDLDEDLDVRIACADALRCYPRYQAVQALIRGLQDQEFSVAWQSRESLKLLSGRDHKYDVLAWTQWVVAARLP